MYDQFSYLLQDKYCYTALHIACENGHAKTAMILITTGANVNFQDTVHNDYYNTMHVCLHQLIIVHFSGWVDTTL